MFSVNCVSRVWIRLEYSLLPSLPPPYLPSRPEAERAVARGAAALAGPTVQAASTGVQGGWWGGACMIGGRRGSGRPAGYVAEQENTTAPRGPALCMGTHV